MGSSNQNFIINIHVEKKDTPYLRNGKNEPSMQGHMWYEITDASGKVMASAGFAMKYGGKFDTRNGVKQAVITPGTVLKDDGGSYAGEPYFTTRLQLTPTQSEMLQNIIKDPQKMGFDNGTIL